MAVTLNKNLFYRISRLPPFCIKTNLRENRLFAARRAIGGQKGTHNVKFSTKNQTKSSHPHTHAWATTWKTHTLTFAKASGYRACTKRHDDLNL